MKLVIEIPDELYERLVYIDICRLRSFIKNGTPLPKRHGRLKDVDWIDDNCEHHYSDTDGSWCYTWKDIDDAPTIIEAESEE